jgi:hypothetical protein
MARSTSQVKSTTEMPNAYGSSRPSGGNGFPRERSVTRINSVRSWSNILYYVSRFLGLRTDYCSTEEREWHYSILILIEDAMVRRLSLALIYIIQTKETNSLTRLETLPRIPENVMGRARTLSTEQTVQLFPVSFHLSLCLLLVDLSNL